MVDLSAFKRERTYRRRKVSVEVGATRVVNRAVEDNLTEDVGDTDKLRFRTRLHQILEDPGVLNNLRSNLEYATEPLEEYLSDPNLARLQLRLWGVVQTYFQVFLKPSEHQEIREPEASDNQ